MKNKLDIKTAVADYAIMLAGAAVYATSVVVFTCLLYTSRFKKCYRNHSQISIEVILTCV